MTDIDHFKNFNDTWGHLTGDQVLRLVAMSLKQNVKGQDIAARYGGEEFAVVLPNTVLVHCARRPHPSRGDVEGTEETGESLGRVTISVAPRRKDDGAESLIERAERLPLRRQAQRPQPRDLRSRSRIRRPDAHPGGLSPVLRFTAFRFRPQAF